MPIANSKKQDANTLPSTEKKKKHAGEEMVQRSVNPPHKPGRDKAGPPQTTKLGRLP